MIYKVKKDLIKERSKTDTFYKPYNKGKDVSLFKFENDKLEVYEPGLFLKYLGLSNQSIRRLAWVINPEPFYYSKEKKRLVLESYYAKDHNKKEYKEAINKFSQLISK